MENIKVNNKEATSVIPDKKNSSGKNFNSQKAFLEDEKVWRVLLKLCAPTILMFLAISIYSITDTIMATSPTTDYYASGNTAISAMGYATTYLSILQSFSVLVNVGAIIKYSTLISKNNHKEAQEFVGSAISGTLIINVVVTGIGIGIAGPAIDLISGHNSTDALGNTTQAVSEAIRYVQIFGISIIFIALYDIIIRFIRTDGNPNISGLIGASGIPINIFFNWVFMGLLDMGIDGGAIASVIGYSLTLIIALSYSLYLSKKSEHSIIFTSWKNLIPKWSFVGTALLFGLPAFTRNILMTVNNFSFIAFSNSITPPDFGSGPDQEFFSVATGVFTQLNNVITSIMRGISQGSNVFFAYWYTKNNYDKLKEGLKWLTIYSFILEGIVAVIVFPLIPEFSGILVTGEISIYGNDLYYDISSMLSSTMVFGFLLTILGFLNSELVIFWILEFLNLRI